MRHQSFVSRSRSSSELRADRRRILYARSVDRKSEFHTLSRQSFHYTVVIVYDRLSRAIVAADLCPPLAIICFDRQLKSRSSFVRRPFA